MLGKGEGQRVCSVGLGGFADRSLKEGNHTERTEHFFQQRKGKQEGAYIMSETPFAAALKLLFSRCCTSQEQFPASGFSSRQKPLKLKHPVHPAANPKQPRCICNSTTYALLLGTTAPANLSAIYLAVLCPGSTPSMLSLPE